MAKEEDRRANNWLRRVQEGSWEPEILISGIVLYGLFQIPDQLDALNHYLNHYSITIFSESSTNESITALLKVSTVWLIIGFISHLFFRSVWVAYVGLSYVYKDGVNLNKLPYSRSYTKHLEKGTEYKRQIIKLEKICSSIFSMSFLLFMWILGICFALLILAFVVFAWITLSPENLEWINYLDFFIQLILLISIIDLVSIGGLKRIPYIRRIYYPFYRLIGWLTLSFLYRNIYYGFVTNYKKWKVSLFLTLFVVITTMGSIVIIKNSDRTLNSFLLAPDESAENFMYSSHYHNLANGKYSDKIHIPSDIADRQVLEVFVVHRTAFEESHIFPQCDYEKQSKSDTINLNRLKMACLNEFYQLKLDSTLIKPEFMYMQNALTKQDGLKAYVDISHLEKGQHELQLYYNFYNSEKDSTFSRNMATVEFYKLSSKQTIRESGFSEK